MKKIITNVLLILFVLLIAESICIFKELKIIYDEGVYIKTPKSEIFQNLKRYTFEMYKDKREFEPQKIAMIRKPAVGNSNKPQIILAGCSFAYGHLLEEKDCLHTILSKMTGRTVSNIGIGSSGFRECYWFFTHGEELKKFVNNDSEVEYIIYVYMSDHKRRLVYDLNIKSPQYKVVDKNKLVLTHDRLIYHFFLYKNYRLLRYLMTSDEKLKNLRHIYITNIHNASKKIYPNSKFVVLICEDEADDDMLSLEKEGIKVITLGKELKENVMQPKYLTIDGIHPNGNLWEKTAKILIKDLNL